MFNIFLFNFSSLVIPLTGFSFKILLRFGAAVNRTDRNGCTPLYKAAYHGRPVLVDILVKAGMTKTIWEEKGGERELLLIELFFFLFIRDPLRVKCH